MDGMVATSGCGGLDCGKASPSATKIGEAEDANLASAAACGGQWCAARGDFGGAVLPFVAADIVRLALVTAFPAIALLLVRLLD